MRITAILHGPVAQLVRVPACHAGGRGFEPLLGRYQAASFTRSGFLLPFYTAGMLAKQNRPDMTTGRFCFAKLKVCGMLLTLRAFCFFALVNDERGECADGHEI